MAKRLVCSSCRHWRSVAGYALGHCRDFGGPERNQDGQWIRANCTRGRDEYLCHQPKLENIW